MRRPRYQRLRQHRRRSGSVWLGIIAVLILAIAGWFYLTRPVSGYFVLVQSAEPETLLPHTLETEASWRLAPLIYSSLVRLQGDGTLASDLAESWWTEDSGLSWVFRLREGAAWHDGRPVTVDDVLFTYKTLARPDCPGPLGRKWRDIPVESPGAQLVVFRLPEADPFFPRRVAAVPVVPAQHLQGIHPADWRASSFGQKPVGSGPFRLVAWEKGKSLQLVPHDQYHLGRAALAGFEVRFLAEVPDPGSLRRWGLDAVLVSGDVNQPAGLFCSRQASRAIAVGSTWYYLLAINQREWPGNQLAVRRAIQAAIDRTLLVRAVGETKFSAVGNPLEPYRWLGLTRPTRASVPQTILADAGFADANGDGVWERGGAELAAKLVVWQADADRVQLARAIARQLGSAGFRVEVVEVDYAEFLAATLIRQDYQLAIGLLDFGGFAPLDELLGSGAGPTADDTGYIRGGANYFGHKDPALDQKLAEFKKADNEDSLKTALWEINQLLIDNPPFIPLLAPRTSLIIGNGVRQVNAGPYSLFSEVHLWRKVR
ncbi:MAG: ABC transporter substrate-binding protein [Bacillota bacterium]